MRIHKGKVKFNTKDTWSLDSVLSNVICEGVTKYKEVINEGDRWRKGIPSSISKEMEDQGVISYEGEYGGLSDEEFKKCEGYLDYVLDEIVYAFDKNNIPDIEAYDFSYNTISEEPNENGTIPFTLECTNEEEVQRYQEDTDKYNKRCEEGRLLFAKHFNGLWW